MTIHRAAKSPDELDPGTDIVAAQTLALRALGWVLAEDTRAARLLALTGLAPDALRSGLDSRAVQAAVLGFLADHEPDLLAAAEALGVEPRRIVAAHALLSD